jgi:hypothetical protein
LTVSDAVLALPLHVHAIATAIDPSAAGHCSRWRMTRSQKARYTFCGGLRRRYRLDLVAWGGIEPPTQGFSVCQDMGVRPSMGTVGDAYDNAMAESFFASLECELIARRVWKTKTEARLAVSTWIEGWYNPRRRHSGLQQMSPNNFERKLHSQSQTLSRQDGLPNGCCAPVDKPPHGLMKVQSACSQAGPMDNPASLTIEPALAPSAGWSQES